MPIDPPSVTAEFRAAAESRRPLRLLIVDDDLVQQELLKRAAGHSGYEIDLAASCADAIRCIESAAFDCVILDLELEDGDGADVCRAMERTSYSGSVIIVSGTDATRRSDARNLARSLGIETQGLRKPVDLSSLRVCLANLGKDLQGLPAIHVWGGAAAGHIREEHRKVSPAARSRHRQPAASRR